MKKSFNNKSTYPAKTLLVGVDISKDKHCARAVNNNNNLESEALFFDNRRKGFQQFEERISRWLQRYGCSSVVIAMEPTAGYWLPLFHYLLQKGFDVRLVSSLKVKRSKDLKDNSPLKSDKKDALLIASLLRDGNVLDYQTQPKNVQEVKDLIKLWEDLDKTETVYRNRMEYFFSKHFPEISDIFSGLADISVLTLLKEYPFPKDMMEAGLEKLTKLLWKVSRGQIKPDKVYHLLEAAKDTVGMPEQNFAQRLQIKAILEVLEITEKLKGSVKAQLEEKLEMMPQYHIMKSINGIGLMTAAAIIASLGDLSQYQNCRQVLKKAGLNLYQFSSGRYRGSDRISRRGMALLRRYLFMAALSNTQKGRSFYWKYSSMVERGVKKKKILVGFMRKLLKLVYALVRDNRVFEIHYDPATGARRDGSVIRWAEAA